MIREPGEKKACRREMELDELLRAGSDLIEACSPGTAGSDLIETCSLTSVVESVGPGADPGGLETQACPPDIAAGGLSLDSTLRGWI